MPTPQSASRIGVPPEGESADRASGGDSPGDPAGGGSADDLPEGYSPADYRGRMRRAPLTASAARPVSPGPDWLQGRSGPGAILDLADRSGGREQVFGVLRLRPGTDLDALNRALAALSELGAVVGAWDNDLRSYTANLPAAALAPVLAADYVMSVEPVPVVAANHGSAVAVMGADASRSYDSSMESFAGLTGSGIAVGVLDTGLNASHTDIAHGRVSVCGANFVPGENWDLWLDLDGHGTHVFGTVAGTGRSDPLLAGMAPNVSHLRFGKVLSASGFGSGEDIRRGMDYMARPTGCWWRAETVEPVKPLIVNMSLSATALRFSGRGVGERKLDAVVYGHSQLYVVAQANSGQHGFSNYGTAKNSLAVGAVEDSGIIAGFSSHGPTADGRLAPNVVGTGVSVTSARGGGSRSAHATYSGTSMASPSVAGVAALLMESRPEFRDRPALTRARLMASAIRPDPLLASREQFPADNTGGPGPFNHRYGLGLVSARTSLHSKPGDGGWLIGSARAQPEDGSYEYVDVVVPDGAARLDIVLTWDEQPADTLTRSVLNNLDLWADAGADCGGGACGEHVSRSEVDNIEWLLIDNPAPGAWKLKVVPTAVYGESPTAAVAWAIQLGDARPALDMRVEDVSESSDSEYVHIDITLQGSRFVASGTTLHLGCAAVGACYALGDAWLPHRSHVIRADGLRRPLPQDYQHESRPISVGEIAVDDPRRVRLTFLREYLPVNADEDPVLHVTATAWNAAAANASLEFAADGRVSPRGDTPPPNDAFAESERIGGTSGQAPLDLSLASREPGEPLVSASSRTLWFVWEAPAKGLYRFRLENTAHGDPWEGAAFRLFTGRDLPDLELAEEKRGHEISFFAEPGVEYRLRVDTGEWNPPPMLLTWEPADARPANDDFAYALAIEGESGSHDSSNEGATLEHLEFHGGSAATVWYAWTAPADGFWEFHVDQGELLVWVFAGARVDELRLVSWPAPRNQAEFFARLGETYRIAVASSSADASGARFTLTWEQSGRWTEPNDWFDSAIGIEGAEGVLRGAGRGNFGNARCTVEPEEPVETGIGSCWWRWTAPKDGRYTFSLDGSSAFRFSIFAGDTLEALRFVGSLHGGSGFVLDAQAGTTYRLALGRVPGSFADVHDGAPSALTWGPTPANDSRAAASLLGGASGTVTARLAYATAQPADPRDTVGEASVWWRWNAPAGGWYRFRVEGDPLSSIVSIYADGARQATATSERSFVANGRVEAYVLARAGENHDIRLSARPGEPTGATEALRWSQAGAPAFLAYRGAVNALDADPSSGSWRSPRNLAMTDGGKYLFASSAGRLYAFERDSATHGLTLAYGLETESNVDDAVRRALLDGSLWWNRREARLISLLGSGGYSFALPAAGSPPNPGREIERVGDQWFPYSAFQGAGSSDGRYFHIADEGQDRLTVYRVDSPERLTHVQTVSSSDEHGDVTIQAAIGTPIDLALSPDESHLYVVADNGLAAFSRDPETGMLDLTQEILTDGDPQGPFSGLGELADVAVDAGGTLLFVFSSQETGSILNSAVAAFDIAANPGSPERLGALRSLKIESSVDTRRLWSHLWPIPPLFGCEQLLPHGDLPAVEVFCRNGYYVVGWNPESGALEVTDFALAGRRDRFGNTLAYDFGFDAHKPYRRQMVSSPDGAAVYRATRVSNHELADAIHIFERAGAMTPD